MPYQIGTATDYKNLLSKLKDFITTPNTLGTVTPGGGDTGNGTVTGVTAVDAAVTETWTLLCTAGGPTGTFSVTGSVSGVKADATVGTAYDNSIVAFTINDGSVDFIIGDSFTFTVTKVMGVEHWTTDRWNTNWDGLNGYEFIVHGPGAGSDAIYVGIQSFFNATDGYFNWRLNGYTGFSSPAVWGSQPGAIPNNSTCYYPNVYLWNSSISYWFVANGRRFVIIAKLGGVYETCYCGFILPYGLPNQWSYPIVIGGSAPSNLVTPNKRYDSQNFCHRAFVDPAGSTGQGSLCLFTGTDWINFRNWSSETNALAGNNVWPYIHSDYNYNLEANSKFLLISRNIDGTFPIFPLVMISNSPTKNCFGELQGCFAAPDTPPVSGDPLVVEDTITISGKTYLVVQNIFRTNYWTYWALLLE